MEYFSEWGTTAFSDISTHFDWIAGLVLTINIILLIFAKYIIRLVHQGKEDKPAFTWKLRTFRGLNLLIIIGYFYFNVYSHEIDYGPGIRTVAILTVLYIAYLTMYISHYLILRRFGRTRESTGEMRYIDTYNSRLLNILSNVFISIIALISVIRLLGFETLLEAGGVIGFIGVFLALTQNSWAPDIFSGLIILNSDILKEGDVIELHNGDKIIGEVFRTKIFHTEVLNLINNHRILIRNSRLRDYAIHNLSKFASAKGLRECLRFKIGYDHSIAKVRSMLEAAYTSVSEATEITIEGQYASEIGITDTGDHAIEWSVFYYTKAVGNILKTRQQMREAFLEISQAHDISLATPMTHDIQMQDLEKIE